MSTLTCCNISEKNKSKSENIKTENTLPGQEIILESTKEDKKTFEPYEHLFYIRISNVHTMNGEKDLPSYSANIIGGSFEVPDGYEVISINAFSGVKGKSSQTAGHDIWFTNNKTVEVESVYNESLDKYDYSNFGKVIEQKDISNQKVLEK